MTDERYWKSRSLTEQDRLIEALGSVEKFLAVSSLADDTGFELSYEALTKIYENTRWWLIDHQNAKTAEIGQHMTELIKEYGECELC